MIVSQVATLQVDSRVEEPISFSTIMHYYGESNTDMAHVAHDFR